MQRSNKGNFKSDLYFRLSILNLKIPLLIARNGDLRLLVDHFTKIYSKKLGKKFKLTAKAVSLLENYAWPGNIRELENIIERLCVISESRIHDEDVREIIKDLLGQGGNNDGSIQHMTYAHILATLAACDGNRIQTAKRLGISRTSLWRILKTPGG